MRTKAPQKAIGYCRVSTERQADNGVSLAAQQEAITRYAELHGLELVNVHIDAGLSGSRADNRPALQAALAEVCKTRGALIVHSLSRLARSTKDAIATAERIDACGADLVSISEKLDTSSAAGRMVFRLLASLAEFERETTAERTVAALNLKRRRGERISGRVPFGFELAADGVALLPVKAEQAVIARILKHRAAGASYGGIAAKLNAAGIAAKAGGQWHAKTVRGVALRGQPSD